MLGTFIDKASGLFEKDFLLAYWFPVFISFSFAVLIMSSIYGLKAVCGLWTLDCLVNSQGGELSAQVLLIAGILILFTMLAYLLMPLTRPLIRFYEGYWPLSLRNKFTDMPILGEKIVWQEKSANRDRAEIDKNWQVYENLHVQLFYGFPTREDRLMPTRLGNILRAAEDYSQQAYGMDCNFWWPRMWPLMPETVQREVKESVTPIIALLNFSFLVVVVSILVSMYSSQEGPVTRSLMVLIAGLSLAMISYRSALAQAQDYGERIRSAMDLYRFDLLKSLHQSLPATLDEERLLWEKLIHWLYTGNRKAVAAMRYDLKRGPKDDGKMDDKC